MKILLTPLGTHGDVHPFIGIGVELARRGHDVIVIANPVYEPLAERAGLPFVPFGTVEQLHTALDNPNLWHPTEGLKLMLGYMIDGMRPLYEMIAAHHVPGETVVMNSQLGIGARIAHDKLGLPLATVHIAPLCQRSARQPPLLPYMLVPRWAPAVAHRFFYWAVDRFALEPMVERPINAYRAELGLAPVRNPCADWWNSPQCILGLYPEWFGPPAPDWPAQMRVCGFPLFDEAGLMELPAELEAFLNAGPPPIVFTPGSGMRHGHAFFQAALEACGRLNCRGIFLTMHPEQLPKTLPDTIHHFTYVPFSAVFPRAAAAVHHGGIGTTAQGLAAGIPQLIMPMGFDQHDNADRLVRLGVGAPLSVKRFTGPNLAAALTTLLLLAVRQRCSELAVRLRQG